MSYISRIKRKKLALILIPIPFFIYFFRDKFISNIVLENIVGLVAILSGIAGTYIGFSTSKMASLEAVREYFQQGDKSEYVKARKNIYNNGEKGDGNISSSDASTVCNFFHFWGLMVRKGYLPIWVFESASGVAVVRLFENLQSYIKERKKENPFYAENFEWLVAEINRVYKKQIRQYYENKLHKDANLAVKPYALSGEPKSEVLHE